MIPVKGETYQYPDSFDVVVLREQVAVSIRDQKVTAIIPLADFAYNDVPVINGRGFAVHVTSACRCGCVQEGAFLQRAVRSLRTSLISGLILRLTCRIVFKDEHWTE